MQIYFGYAGSDLQVKVDTELEQLGFPRSGAEVREARRRIEPVHKKVGTAIRELSARGDRRAGGNV